jgi:cell division septal protein FtsQ
MKSGKVIDLRGGKRPEPARERTAASASHHRDRGVSPIRVRRRKLRAIVVVIALLLITLAVYGVHWVSYLPRFTVRTIQIHGAEQIDPLLIQSYVGSVIDNGSYHFLSRANIFLYPKTVVEKGIVGSFPRVSAANMSRDGILGQDLSVTITERTPFAQWCTSSDQVSCFAMDDQGFIFAAAASSTDSIRFAQPYLFTGGVATTTANEIGQTFAPGHVPGLLALLHLLVQNDELTPVSVEVEDDQDFSIMFSQGFLLKASYGEDANALARNIQLVLGSDTLKDQQANLEYIDLRFGNRVYYKLKGQDQTAV